MTIIVFTRVTICQLTMNEYWENRQKDNVLETNEFIFCKVLICTGLNCTYGCAHKSTKATMTSWHKFVGFFSHKMETFGIGQSCPNDKSYLLKLKKPQQVKKPTE